MGCIKLFLPPIIYSFFIRFKKNKYGWSGDYSIWSEAEKESIGYDSDLILQKVKQSLLLVRDGKANYERDSVIFNDIQYSWSLLAGLLYASTASEKNLNIIDFGGSLGSSYYQNRLFLNNTNYVWNVVEQADFVSTGRNLFENKHLKFCYEIEDCFDKQSKNILILSSVLQYLEYPIGFLEKIIDQFDFDYIIIDRTSFIKGDRDRLTIQKVPPSIYNAIYPCWFFNQRKIMNLFSFKYKLLADFQALDVANIPGSYYKGFIYKLKNERTNC